MDWTHRLKFGHDAWRKSLMSGTTETHTAWGMSKSHNKRGHPQMICGDDLVDFRDNLRTQSFVGILWSNGGNSEGKFEVEARCTGHPIPTDDTESSGDSILY